MSKTIVVDNHEWTDLKNDFKFHPRECYRKNYAEIHCHRFGSENEIILRIPVSMVIGIYNSCKDQAEYDPKRQM